MASSVWKGHLTFGLVSFPVRLFSAARSETISFNLLHKEDHSRIKQVVYCQAEDKPVPRSELVKGYEYEKDHYVEIDDEDIKKVAPKTAKVMEILEFVKADEVDPIYLESSYYVAPDEGGEKPYALLFQALRESKYYALAKIAMHNREHIIVLRPGAKGILSHTMYYAGRDPPRGRVPHRHQPGEGERTGHGEDADRVARSRVRAAEISRQLSRQSAEDDRGEDRGPEGGGDADARTSRR